LHAFAPATPSHGVLRLMPVQPSLDVPTLLHALPQAGSGAAPHPLAAITCLGSRDAGWLDALAAQGRFARYGAGDIAGGPGAGETAVGFVLAGVMRISLPADRHGDVTFFDIAAGGLFGHLDALAGLAPTLSAVAQTGTDVFILPADRFTALLQSEPAIALALLQDLATDLVTRTPRPLAADTGRAGTALYADLLRMAEPDTASEGGLIISRLPRHRELAAMCGLDEQTVAAGLAALVKSGCAERQYPGLRILDPAYLRALATGTPATD